MNRTKFTYGLFVFFIASFFCTSGDAATHKLMQSKDQPVLLYQCVVPGSDNAIVKQVIRADSQSTAHDFIIQKDVADKDNRESQYLLLHHTGKRLETIPIEFNQAHREIVFGCGIYREGNLIIPVITDFQALWMITIDVVHKKVFAINELKTDIPYREITNAFIDRYNRLYIIAKPESQPEVFYLDIASGKRLKKISPSFKNIFVTAISDLTWIENTLYITGVAMDEAKNLFSWIGKAGLGNRIQKSGMFPYDLNQSSAPTFISTEKELAVINLIKTHGNYPQITVFDKNLNTLNDIKIDYNDRIFSANSVYQRFNSAVLYIEREKRKDRQCLNVILQHPKKKRKQLTSMDEHHEMPQVYKKAFLYRIGTKYFLATNYDTVTNDRRITMGFSIYDLNIDTNEINP